MAEATLADIATRAGVSVGTVSRILNGKNKESWRVSRKRAALVRGIATELNYRPHAAARAMQSRRSMCVGVLVRNSPEDRFINIPGYETFLGINEGLSQAGYLVALIRIGEVRKGLRSESRVFREQAVDGVIVTSGLADSVESQVEEIVPLCVWIDSNVWRPQRCIRRDEEEAGALAAGALIDGGYRRLVWCGRMASVSQEHYSYTGRLAGAERVARQHGLTVEILDESEVEALKEPKVLQQWARADTGIVAYDTHRALRLAHSAAATGLRPGYEFGLVCCDESYEVAFGWPELSRVSFSRFDMGRQAAAMMLAVLEDPEADCPSEEIHGRWIPGGTAWGPERVQPGAS